MFQTQRLLSRFTKHPWGFGHSLWRALAWCLLLIVFAFNAWWLTVANGFTDFGSFVAAAQEFAGGRNPYSADNPLVFYVHFDQLNLTAYAVNLNPPISILLLAPLARVDPLSAFGAWRLISLILYSTATARLLHAYQATSNPFRALWVLSLAGFWHTLVLGQIYMPLLLLCIGAWLLLRSNRHVWAGVLLGALIAMKPNFLIWAFFLLVSGSWTAALAAAASAAVLTFIPALWLGPGVYYEWWKATSAFTGTAFPANNSLVGLFVRFGAPWVGTLLAFILVGILALRIWDRRVSAIQASALGLVASLLAAPIAWTGYTIFLLPVYLSRRWTPLLRISALMLAFPFPLILLFFQKSRFGFVFFGWFYGWALLLLLIEIIRETHTGHPRSHRRLIGKSDNYSTFSPYG